jgi:hypothetical protein
MVALVDSLDGQQYHPKATKCKVLLELNSPAILPDLFEHALIKTACENVLCFLGRKLHGNFRGQVTTDLKKRPEGWRVKHTIKCNSLKMYDKNSVLRVETTINNPSEFKICQPTEDGKLRWVPTPAPTA